MSGSGKQNLFEDSWVALILDLDRFHYDVTCIKICGSCSKDHALANDKFLHYCSNLEMWKLLLNEIAYQLRNDDTVALLHCCTHFRNFAKVNSLLVRVILSFSRAWIKIKASGEKKIKEERSFVHSSRNVTPFWKNKNPLTWLN